MSSPDYDRIIAQERKVLASIKEHSEKLIPEFKKTTASYIRELGISLLKSYFTHKSDVAAKLGKEKSEALKGEFKAILDSLTDQTSKRLDDSQIWLHRVEIPDHAISDMKYSYQFEKKSSNATDRAIRDLIGIFGSLLIKYGFLDIKSDYNWIITPGEIPQYANDLPSKNMEHYKALARLMEQYKNLLVEYVYATQNLRKAEQAKGASQAK